MNCPNRFCIYSECSYYDGSYNCQKCQEEWERIEEEQAIDAYEWNQYERTWNTKPLA